MVLLVVAGFVDIRVQQIRFDEIFESPRSRDWYWLLRVFGSLWTWFFAAVAFTLIDLAARRRRSDRPPLWFAFRRATLLLTLPCACGIAASLLKIVFRRLRPDQADGAWYAFRPFADKTFDGGGLCLPSEHTCVAFGAALALAHLVPDARWLWLLLAAGCGATRIITGDHYTSDVVAGALVAFGTVAILLGPLGHFRHPFGDDRT